MKWMQIEFRREFFYDSLLLRRNRFSLVVFGKDEEVLEKLLDKFSHFKNLQNQPSQVSRRHNLLVYNSFR